tara:strand:- start:573 stop:773 length:201 start_codon:yes stop_codon:yes gene_type:complete
MAETEKEKRYKRNVKNSVLLMISVVLLTNAIKIIENEKSIIEIIILKKSEKYDKREIEEVLRTALR